LSHRFRAILAAAAVAVSLIGCAENTVVETRTPSVAASNSSAATEADGIVDSLAHGLAIALGDASIRSLIRNDLRDSPFRLHALHLTSYLNGVRGRAIAAKAAAALRIQPEAFVRIAQSGPDFELVMPRVLDRVSWEGAPSSMLPLSQRHSKNASKQGEFTSQAMTWTVTRFLFGHFAIHRAHTSSFVRPRPPSPLKRSMCAPPRPNNLAIPWRLRRKNAASWNNAEDNKN